MVKISIIVAAYNVEKYILRCIKSIQHQSYKNIEIIIVNDCSTDLTANICSDLCRGDYRLRLINKDQNEGLSAARNTGINIATGDYITFVDGDDYLELNAIECCINAINMTLPDEIVFGSFFDRKDGTIQNMVMSHSLTFYSGDKMKSYFDEAIGSLPDDNNDRNIGITPWGRIYKKDIFDMYHLRFISERLFIYEDLTFFLLSFSFIKSVTVLDESLYHYCENEGSLTQKVDLNRFYRVKKMYDYIKCNYKDLLFLDNETQLRFKRLMLSYIRLSCMQVSKAKNSIGLLHEICYDDFTKEILYNYPVLKLPLKQKIFACLIKFRCAFLLGIILKIYS